MKARAARLLRGVATLRGLVVGLAVALLVVAAVLVWQTQTLKTETKTKTKTESLKKLSRDRL